jgi:plastocyanin
LSTVACGLLLAGVAQAKTYKVTAGPLGNTGNQQLDMDAFFASSVKIHVGDKVTWTINGLHDVAFVPKGKATPAFVLPDATHPVPPLSDAAGAPFWFVGKPSLTVNPVAAFGTGGTTVTGKTLVASAVPAGSGKPKPVTFKFTKVGTFKYLCIVHPVMRGTVKVLAKSKTVPTPAAVAKTAKAQFKAAVKTGKKLATTTPPAATVFAGHDKGPVAWLRFFPASLTVKVGQPVTFKVSSKVEAHTVTFGPAAYTGDIAKNLIGAMPQAAGPPVITLNPLAVYPSDVPALPALDGTNHGNGFVNAGLIDTDAATPNPSSATFKFSKAGTYNYICALHGGMHGTIVVTQ